MVHVDLSNPWMRAYLSKFGALHRGCLDDLRKRLSGWVAASRSAEATLAAAEKRNPRPLAVVVDIDEVLLCNVHMNSFQAAAGVQGPDPIDFHAADHFTGPDGKPWPRTELRLNPLLPGARELLESFRTQGLRIYMITGRLESIRDETIENFVHVGLAGDTDDFIFRTSSLTGPSSPLIMSPDAEHPKPGESIRPFKESRRFAIEASHRIVANIGDQASDLGLHGDVQIICQHPFYWTP